MPDEEKMEEISDELSEGKSGGFFSIFKKLPILIFTIVIVIILSYLLVIKVIKPMLTSNPQKEIKKIETLKPKDNPQEVIQKTNEGEEIPTEEKKPIGTIYTFENDFMFNPLVKEPDDEYSIFIVSLSVEVDNSEVVPEIEERMPQLRDIVIEILSAKTLKELIKPETKVRLKTEIKKEFNKLLIKGKVTNVFFNKYQFQIM